MLYIIVTRVPWFLSNFNLLTSRLTIKIGLTPFGVKKGYYQKKLKTKNQSKLELELTDEEYFLLSKLIILEHIIHLRKHCFILYLNLAVDDELVNIEI